MTLALYSFLMWMLQPAVRLKVRLRARKEPGYLHAVDERFGLYTHCVADESHIASVTQGPSGPLIWMHAVSLGETRAAAVLLHALRNVRVRLLEKRGPPTRQKHHLLAINRPYDRLRAEQTVTWIFHPSDDALEMGFELVAGDRHEIDALTNSPFGQ